MTGYLLKPEIVGWRRDFADNPRQDPRFETVWEDGMALHYPWGQEAPWRMGAEPGSLTHRFLVHEPVYRPVVGDPDQRFACEHCGDIVHPVTELR